MNKEKNIVKKHVSTIHIKNQLSILQRKAYNALLINAYEELLTDKIHEIDISLLAKLINFNSTNTKVLKNSLEELTKTVIEWDILEDNIKEWGSAAILSFCKITKGICYYSYTAGLREKLYDPKIFALLKINILKKFRTKYGLILYENCYRFKNLGSTGWIELNKFKELMGVSDISIYNDFKHLNRKIIGPAIKEIADISDIKISSVETKKVKRKIVALKLNLIANDKQSLPIEFSATELENKKLMLKLQDFGITSRQALEIVLTYNKDYINEILTLIEERQRNGIINNNLAAYTVKALKEDYRIKPNKFEKEKKEKKENSEKKQLLKNSLKYFEIAFVQHKEQNIKEFIKNMASDEHKKAEDDFIKAIESKKGLTLKTYQKHGLDSKMIQAKFYKFIEKTFKINENVTKESVAKAMAIDITKIKEELKEL